MHQVGFLFTRL